MGTRVASASGSQARVWGPTENWRSGGEVGAWLGGRGLPQSNSLAKTKRGGEGGGPLQTLLVFLSDFKLARIAEVEPRGSRKDRVQGLEVPAAELGEGGPSEKSEPTSATAAGALSLP